MLGKTCSQTFAQWINYYNQLKKNTVNEYTINGKLQQRKDPYLCIIVLIK